MGARQPASRPARRATTIERAAVTGPPPSRHDGSVRIWFDECLSPSLTATARDRGYESTCNLHRDLLGATDAELFSVVTAEDWTFATNNAGDFTQLAAADADLHAGVVIVPQRLAADQPRILRAVLDYIEARAADGGEAARDWLVNEVVEMSDDEQITARPLPDR